MLFGINVLYENEIRWMTVSSKTGQCKDTAKKEEEQMQPTGLNANFSFNKKIGSYKKFKYVP